VGSTPSVGTNCSTGGFAFDRKGFPRREAAGWPVAPRPSNSALYFPPF
jgi:hypothetical protein